MHTFYQSDVSSGHLFAEESRHAIKVLRLQAGDPFELTDGKGKLLKAIITRPDPRQCEFEISETKAIPKRDFSIHLAIAPTKNADRMEWMVEKCIEIGIEKISFVLCRTSERKTINKERIEKVAISAIKQSRRAWLPELVQMVPIEDFIKARKERSKFIAYVDDKNPEFLKNLASPRIDYVVLIGPEGDFTEAELSAAVSAGFQKVSLGPTRLRTETAGFTAVVTLNLLNQG